MTFNYIDPILSTTRPDVAITLERTHDEYFVWNGDGPDPQLDGYLPYDVDVRVSLVRKGHLYTGSDSLGGCYFLVDEPFGDIHGYLPDMIEAALAELDAILEQKESV